MLAPHVVAGAADLADPSLAAVEHLTGVGALAMLDAAVGELGGRVGRVRIVQVAHDPGRTCTVTYEVEVETAGTVVVETIVAATSVDGPPPGAAVLESDGLEVGLWRYPFDPALPALCDAVTPGRVESLLAGRLAGPLEPTVVTYRPGRRAVVRVSGPDATLYLKVLRPQRVARLAERHRALCAAGVPVPELVHADTSRGLVVLGPLDGGGAVVLRSLLTGMTRGAVPDARHLAEVLDALALAGPIDGAPARRSPLRDVAVHAAASAAVMPEEAGRVTDLLGRLRVEDPGDPDGTGAGVLVHGDLHDGQLMVDPAGRIVGVLDLDDVGIGTRADDLGNLLGHATTLVAAGAPDGIADRWCDRVLDLADVTGLDRREVARRAAAATISLATGPFRSREPGWREQTRSRLAAAARLLDRDGAGSQQQPR